MTDQQSEDYEQPHGIPYQDPHDKSAEDKPLIGLEASFGDGSSPAGYDPIPTKQDVLEEAIGAVIQNNATYDNPRDNFQRIANLWNTHIRNAYPGRTTPPTLSALDVAIMMDMVKTARLQFNPTHHDSWVDKAGYSACGGEIAAEERSK